MVSSRYWQTGARMRRAVILATLTCILFAVAGVTAATENSFTSSSQYADQTGSTVPEPRGPERTAPEVTVPETTIPEGVSQGRSRRGQLRWDPERRRDRRGRRACR